MGVQWTCPMKVLTTILLTVVFEFLCPRHSKNGGGALSVTPVRASVRYQNLVSAQLLLKDCIDSIQIWYVDI